MTDREFATQLRRLLIQAIRIIEQVVHLIEEKYLKSVSEVDESK